MTTTRTVYSDSQTGVAVSVVGDLDRLVVEATRAAQLASIDALWAAAGDVADKARAAWYDKPGGVHRVTGQSGDIRVVTSIEDGGATVRVSVGSTDTRTASVKRKNTKGALTGVVGVVPLPVVVHNASTLSYESVKVSRAVYMSTPEALREDFPFIKRQAGLATHGRPLLEKNVRAPMKGKAERIAKALGEEIARRIKEVKGG